MHCDSFECEVDFAAGQYVHLESHDGIVTMSTRDLYAVSDEHKETCRKYAEMHLKRIGRPFFRCDF